MSICLSDHLFQPTIHGKCRTYYYVNTTEDIATEVTLTRDLSRCDKFVPMRDHTSPLALVSGMVRYVNVEFVPKKTDPKSLLTFQ